MPSSSKTGIGAPQREARTPTFLVQATTLCLLYVVDTFTHLAALLDRCVCLPPGAPPDPFHAHLAPGLAALFPEYPCAGPVRPAAHPTAAAATAAALPVAQEVLQQQLQQQLPYTSYGWRQVAHLLSGRRFLAAHLAYLSPPLLCAAEAWALISVCLTAAFPLVLAAAPAARRDGRWQLVWFGAAMANELLVPAATWALAAVAAAAAARGPAAEAGGDGTAGVGGWAVGSEEADVGAGGPYGPHGPPPPGYALPSFVAHYPPVMVEALVYSALLGLPTRLVALLAAASIASLSAVSALLHAHGLAGAVGYSLPALWRQLGAAVAVVAAFCAVRGRLWAALLAALTARSMAAAAAAAAAARTEPAGSAREHALAGSADAARVGAGPRAPWLELSPGQPPPPPSAVAAAAVGLEQARRLMAQSRSLCYCGGGGSSSSYDDCDRFVHATAAAESSYYAVAEGALPQQQPAAAGPDPPTTPVAAAAPLPAGRCSGSSTRHDASSNCGASGAAGALPVAYQPSVQVLRVSLTLPGLSLADLPPGWRQQLAAQLAERLGSQAAGLPHPHPHPQPQPHALGDAPHPHTEQAAAGQPAWPRAGAVGSTPGGAAEHDASSALVEPRAGVGHAAPPATAAAATEAAGAAHQAAAAAEQQGQADWPCPAAAGLSNSTAGGAPPRGHDPAAAVAAAAAAAPAIAAAAAAEAHVTGRHPDPDPGLGLGTAAACRAPPPPPPPYAAAGHGHDAATRPWLGVLSVAVQEVEEEGGREEQVAAGAALWGGLGLMPRAGGGEGAVVPVPPRDPVPRRPMAPGVRAHQQP
ncbi:hypothetical protein HXX76_014620 [Chlamydomonas incerta]|uniref:Uncharacterized protein n=1 Tax=Chlamydomonas incerta TaxID=51695 RepID=A0A835SF60_CHLIN|nr:hypothetical protein HXX76_014620 [Chlamydomonas incerta]|eukprot:KAG2424411.1 hypothetical protein HXX76_014620 [Chlamydomonas incerta]